MPNKHSKQASMNKITSKPWWMPIIQFALAVGSYIILLQVSTYFYDDAIKFDLFWGRQMYYSLYLHASVALVYLMIDFYNARWGKVVAILIATFIYVYYWLPSHSTYPNRSIFGMVGCMATFWLAVILPWLMRVSNASLKHKYHSRKSAK